MALLQLKEVSVKLQGAFSRLGSPTGLAATNIRLDIFFHSRPHVHYSGTLQHLGTVGVSSHYRIVAILKYGET